MNSEINKKRIVLNTFFLYGKTLITMLISLFSTRLILEGLGKMDFGIYGTVGGAIVMLESLNLAMAQATQRYMNYAEGSNNKNKLFLIFNNTVLLHIGLGIFIVILMGVLYYPLFNGIFNIPTDRIFAAKLIYLFLAISGFFTITTVPYDALINAHEDFLYYSIVGIIISILKLVAALVIINYSDDRLILYGLLISAISIINMSIMRVYCKIKYTECSFHPRSYGKLEVIKELGVFAGWNFVGALSNMAGNHGSTILMNHFFGPIIIGAKNIGDQVCTQVSVLTINMTKALNPVIVKSEGGGDRGTMIRLSFLSCRFCYLLYFLLAIPFLFNSDLLLKFWLKNVPNWAVLFCQLQVLRTLLEQLFNPLNTSLMAQGSIKHLNLHGLLLGLFTLLLLYILYQLGFQAYWHYYISIFLLVIIYGIIKLYLCNRICNMKYLDYFRLVLSKCFVVSVLSIIIIGILYGNNLLEQNWFSFVVILLINTIIITIFGLTAIEKNTIKNYMIKGINKISILSSISNN